MLALNSTFAVTVPTSLLGATDRRAQQRDGRQRRDAARHCSRSARGVGAAQLDDSWITAGFKHALHDAIDYDIILLRTPLSGQLSRLRTQTQPGQPDKRAGRPGGGQRVGISFRRRSGAVSTHVQRGSEEAEAFMRQTEEESLWGCWSASTGVVARTRSA